MGHNFNDFGWVKLGVSDGVFDVFFWDNNFVFFIFWWFLFGFFVDFDLCGALYFILCFFGYLFGWLFDFCPDSFEVVDVFFVV